MAWLSIRNALCDQQSHCPQFSNCTSDYTFPGRTNRRKGNFHKWCLNRFYLLFFSTAVIPILSRMIIFLSLVINSHANCINVPSVSCANMYFLLISLGPLVLFHVFCICNFILVWSVTSPPAHFCVFSDNLALHPLVIFPKDIRTLAVGR